MAKKKMIPMASDTQLDVALIASDATGVGQAAVDVVEEMCKVNHRLYRQAMSYPVSFRLVDSSGFAQTRSYSFYTLANNWLYMARLSTRSRIGDLLFRRS